MNDWEERPRIEEALFEKAIGREVLNYIKEYDPAYAARQVDSEAVRLLNEIQAILDDERLDDAECFYRIDAIVCAFHSYGVPTQRHWELD